MHTHPPLILASGSPRRQQLLRDMDFDFSVVVREVDESFPPDLSPEETALYIARKKAAAYADLAADSLVITSDTIVAIGGQILGKPQNEQEAMSMLAALSGRTHQVITAVALCHRARMEAFAEITEVEFAELPTTAIRYYVDRYRPYDKAGAYGIQEWIGMVGITAIRGDYYNVMGLPTARLHAALQGWEQDGTRYSHTQTP